MKQFDWFEEDEGDDLTDAQRVFLGTLRQQALHWPCLPDDTQLAEPDGECPSWRAVLAVGAQIDDLGLITVGVSFDGHSIRASQLHSQSFCPYPADSSRVEVLEATGAPEELGELAAAWFERILRRPVVCREWGRGRQATREWGFADCEQGLVVGGAGRPRTGNPEKIVVHVRGQALPADDRPWYGQGKGARS